MVDAPNMVERLLQKGDRLKGRYDDFDYGQLDSSQTWWLDKLSLYTKYRKRIVDRYNGTTISSDLKIMYLD